MDVSTDRRQLSTEWKGRQFLATSPQSRFLFGGQAAAGGRRNFQKLPPCPIADAFCQWNDTCWIPPNFTLFLVFMQEQGFVLQSKPRLLCNFIFHFTSSWGYKMESLLCILHHHAVANAPIKSVWMWIITSKRPDALLWYNIALVYNTKDHPSTLWL